MLTLVVVWFVVWTCLQFPLPARERAAVLVLGLVGAVAVCLGWHPFPLR